MNFYHHLLVVCDFRNLLKTVIMICLRVGRVNATLESLWPLTAVDSLQINLQL